MRAATTLACAGAVTGAIACSLGAAAMVGGAPPAGDGLARAVVMLTGSHGTFCSGVALARDLVLTAAHCVPPGADYKLVEFDAALASEASGQRGDAIARAHSASKDARERAGDTRPEPGSSARAARQPLLRDVARVVRHPDFDVNAALRHRVTADVALIKLAAALKVVPALLAPEGGAVAAGDRFVVAGYGLAVRGDGRTGGTVRAATLVATGQPGTLQIRLADPATNGERAGLGACTGDSGAPVYRDVGGTLAVVGVVSWSTGPALSEGCGGLTGVTPLVRYRAWIVEQAGRLGSPLAP